MCVWEDRSQSENIWMILQFDFFAADGFAEILGAPAKSWGEKNPKKLQAKQTVDAKSHQLLKRHLALNKIKLKSVD